MSTKQLFFVSFGTDAHECIELYWSAKLMDIPLKITGLNKPWRGFQMKLLAVKEFIDNVEKIHPAENVVICFVDGYDVLFADSAANILSKFEAFDKPFVISAEKNLKPDSSRSMQQVYDAASIDSPSPFKYVNSGTYIGTLEEIKKFITWCEKYNYNCPAANRKRYAYCDDQRALTTYFFQNQDVCALDHEQKIFSCLADCSPNKTLEIRPGGVIHNKATSQDTSIIHLNGRSKRHKRKVLGKIKAQLCTKQIDAVKKAERIKILRNKLKNTTSELVRKGVRRSLHRAIMS
jgi:hypothetical protein